MFFTIAFDVLIAALILYRQRRIRPVPRVLHLRLPVFLGALGLVEVLDYTGHHHHISSSAYWLVLGVTVIGAGVLGAVRAATVQLWASHQWIVRQGTWLTMALWVFSLAVHLFSGVGAAHVGASGLEANSFLLYLALTLGVQAYVVHLRAAPMWAALGPDAGQRFRVTFGSNGGVGSFFGGFGDFDGSAQPYVDPHHNDPTIIDAEVVEDDPPELR